jgi:hypothetical protein
MRRNVHNPGDIVQPIGREAKAALAEFEAVASRIPVAWNSVQTRLIVLQDLLTAGERLRAALAALPEGIVIP